MQPLIKIVSGLALALAVAQPAAAQTLRGSLDWVDQDTVAGWACYLSDPFTHLTVELRAQNTATLQWVSLGNHIADRERNDIGHTQICGVGTLAFYHGFELTIFPESMLASQGTYQIHAFVGGQPLAGTGTVSFASAGLPAWGIWRTDYDDPSQRAVSMVSCIWPFKGANPTAHQNLHPDPHFLGAGATVLGNWAGNGPVWCLRNDRFFAGDWYWNQSNSATNAATWPMSNYWVISPNNELAYSKTQSGPPSQSQPVNIGDLYSVSMVNDFFFLGIDNASAGYQKDNTPYLSLGAQMGRGAAGPLAFIQPAGPDTHLEFTIHQLFESGGDYHDIAAYVELMWGGYKRWIGVSFRQPATRARFHWNWNALESFWFPGGEFNILGTWTVGDYCSLGPNAHLPVLTARNVGQDHFVSIPLRGLLQCLENSTIPNQNAGQGILQWSSSRPTGLPLAITGFQIAIEQAPGQPTAAMETRFTKPVLVNR